MSLLDDYIDEAMQKPWGYGGMGVQDCTIWAADWCLKLTGVDPAADLRNKYTTEGIAVSIVRERGGMMRFVGDRLVALDWTRVNLPDVPDDGDIGIVLAPILPATPFGLIPAIRKGGMWCCRTNLGYGAKDFEFKIAWRAPE